MVSAWMRSHDSMIPMAAGDASQSSSSFNRYSFELSGSVLEVAVCENSFSLMGHNRMLLSPGASQQLTRPDELAWDNTETGRWEQWGQENKMSKQDGMRVQLFFFCLPFRPPFSHFLSETLLQLLPFFRLSLAFPTPPFSHFRSSLSAECASDPPPTQRRTLSPEIKHKARCHRRTAICSGPAWLLSLSYFPFVFHS